MLYTVAQAEHGIIIMGAIPQFDLNALLSVWQPKYEGALRGYPELAQKLGYSIVLGTEENLKIWAEQAGVVNEPEEVAEPS